ncbi:MAG: DUF1573 domain-containing protein [Clostridiaceae bacterium]
MKDIIVDNFQNSVDDSLLRHKSLLDILSKLQQTESRVNRAVTKSVTSCGCIEINARKQKVPTEDDYIDEKSLKNCLDTHVDGHICDNCRDIIEREIGNHLFYLTALCNTLDVNLYDVLLKEYDKINTLGKFTLR